ncbi:ParB/RepB/Spo0J family partition protein [Azospirillum sp.]|uniref:ParB/RepB/Spo0J family partition protein n=1 Tax=Azospirillum sp. TaxID=34012 RepID=UPI003D73C337
MPQPVSLSDAVMLPVAAIALPDTLARRRIDPEGVDALVRSIGEHGLLQPVLVRPLPDGRYELLAGLRRLRAVQAIRQSTVPARLLPTGAPAVLSLVENLQRDPLDALELAEALKRLEDDGRSRAAIAALVGKSRTWVADALSLNTLPDAIKAEYPAVRKAVTRSLLVEIARVRDPEAQLVLWEEAKAGALTVRAVRAKRREMPPLRVRAVATAQRCAKQLGRLDAAALEDADRKALMALRERIDALLEPSPAPGEGGAKGAR